MKKLAAFFSIIAVFIFFIPAQFAYADSIAIDNSGKATASSASSVTLSYTTGTLTNGYMVACGVEGNSTVGHGIGFTYNGVSMTQIAATQESNNNWRIYLFVLPNPASGTHNLVMSTDGTSESFLEMVNATYSGASQLTTVDSFNTGVAVIASTLPISTTVVAANSWVGACYTAGNVINSVTNVGTKRQDNITGTCGSTNGSSQYYDTNGTVSTGSYSTTAQICAAANAAGIVFSLAPATAAAATPTPLIQAIVRVLWW